MGIILVVDDDADTRAQLTEILEEGGHEVLTAEDGQAGLESAKNFAPDAVLSDISMPRMDGMVMLQRLREARETADLPVILMTDRPTPKEKKAAVHLNVVDYLPKPLEAADIELRVKWALKAGSATPAVPWDMVVDGAGPNGESLPGAGAGSSGDAPSAEDSGFDAKPGESVRAVTPQRGGSVRTADGQVHVEVPPDAVPDTLGLHVASGSEQSEPDEGTLRMRLGKNAADLRFSDSSGTAVSGLELKNPARIGIKYTENEVQQAGEERLIRVQEYDRETGRWVDLVTSVDLTTRIAYTEKRKMPRPPVRKKSGRVLVIEPSAVEFQKILSALEGTGFRVLRETQPQNVRDRIVRERPFMVILGLDLAGADAIRLLRDIKMDPDVRKVTVILIAHPDDPDAYSDALSLGARDVLPGPVQMGQLQFRVNRAFQAVMARLRKRVGRTGPPYAPGAPRAANAPAESGAAGLPGGAPDAPRPLNAPGRPGAPGARKRPPGHAPRRAGAKKALDRRRPGAPPRPRPGPHRKRIRPAPA